MAKIKSRFSLVQSQNALAPHVDPRSRAVVKNAALGFHLPSRAAHDASAAGTVDGAVGHDEVASLDEHGTLAGPEVVAGAKGKEGGNVKRKTAGKREEWM